MPDKPIESRLRVAVGFLLVRESTFGFDVFETLNSERFSCIHGHVEVAIDDFASDMKYGTIATLSDEHGCDLELGSEMAGATISKRSKSTGECVFNVNFTVRGNDDT
jgi:hypothetical protein